MNIINRHHNVSLCASQFEGVILKSSCMCMVIPSRTYLHPMYQVHPKVCATVACWQVFFSVGDALCDAERACVLFSDSHTSRRLEAGWS